MRAGYRLRAKGGGGGRLFGTRWALGGRAGGTRAAGGAARPPAPPSCAKFRTTTE